MYFSGWEGTPGLHDARFWAGCRQKYDLYHPRDFFLTLNLLVLAKTKLLFRNESLFLNDILMLMEVNQLIN